MTEKESLPSGHWADSVAQQLLELNPEKDTLVCASGISPSGMVHIGNFREVITVDFVVRALKKRGKNVRFIYSWDDYDALRKVPKNLPNQETIESNLRKPISDVPDPFEKDASYAKHFENTFEAELRKCWVSPDYIYQNQAYRANEYTEGIKTALENVSTIRSILNEARTQDLPETWMPISIYCKETGKDECKFLEYIPPYTIKYFSRAAKKEMEVDFSKEPGVKLLWRVDWPMRWAKEGVDFEPGGKDHSSEGGSYDTGKKIIKEVWNQTAPHYQQYDFVMTKGLGGKMSSSTGQLMTLSQAYEVYEPQLVRWLFASRKPNMDFSIAFDLDVLKAYDDFDRTERIAFKEEEAEEKKFTYEKMIYELSVEDINATEGTNSLPNQIPFRHLCNIIQIYEGNLDEAKTYYKDLIKSPLDEARYYSRAQCAWNWVKDYAPEAFRFSLRSENDVPDKTEYPKAIEQVVTLLNGDYPKAEDELAQAIFKIMKAEGLQAKAFFAEIYRILINKQAGPKLAPFILTIGPQRTVSILEKAL